MNVIEIEERIEQLAQNGFKPADFIYDFIAVYDAPKAILRQLRQGQQNPSEIGGILWRRYMHYKGASKGAVSATIDELQDAKENAKHKVRYLISTDGDQFSARDLKSGETLNCDFGKLGDHFGFFLPLANIERYKIADENPVDIKATGRLAKLYDSILEDNPSWRTEDKRHTLNHFMTQIVFCLFAEDTGIFPQGIFSESIKTYCENDTSQTQLVLTNIFTAISLPEDARGEQPAYAKRFPYVNGGLFADNVAIPNFLRGSVRYLLDAAMLDWRQINPDIFGSMIQSIVNEDQRGELGMHYTSVPNILKVLEPLFLNDLREQVKVNWQSKKGLHSILQRISNIKVFDPACGSGNFLVIAYRELRSIEIIVINRLAEIDNYTPPLWSNVELKNFYGIEYADFAAETARLSLWIAEYQMNSRYKDEFGQRTPALPLKSTGNIACENALRIEWDKVCPHHSDPSYETYIVGNPPYLGNVLQSKEQKDDLNQSIGHLISEWKSLDYVAGWLIKTSEYIKNKNATFAFVTTNSICQGQQVAPIWSKIIGNGQEIFFAHTSFKWKNNALNNAGVTCVIVGVRNIGSGPKFLISDDTMRITRNINAYLASGDNLIIEKRSAPLSNSMPKMVRGNIPNDGGHLIFTAEERAECVKKYPHSKRFFRQIYGSQEFIKGIQRFCIWVEDDELSSAMEIEPFKIRFDLVRQSRLSSKKENTRIELSKVPHRFESISGANKKFIIIPALGSENRDYYPVGYLMPDCIPSGMAYAIFTDEIWVSAILNSRLHRVWLEAVGGKLETRLLYSNTIVYNNLPFGTISEVHKKILADHAEEILLARDRYFEHTISELYDVERMADEFPILLNAHRANDDTIEELFFGKKFRNDENRFEALFEKYGQLLFGTDEVLL